MTRLVATAFLIALTASAALPAAPAAAQENTLGGAIIGGLLGAGIGGAIGRGGGAVAGGVIGATTGALIGSQHDRWRYAGGGYFWSGGRCFYQYPSGGAVRVARGNCY